MPGTPHEVLIMKLRDRPALLAELVRKVAGESLREPLMVVDSTVRFSKAIEVRPDLIFRSRKRGWTIVEIQNRIDEQKRRSWPLAASLLIHQDQVMGEIFVLTASRRVAAWAEQAAHLKGEIGTRFELTPVVLLLAGELLESLLDPAHPELALFAVWAMHHRHGPEARAVVDRAVELAERLPRPLRKAQERAIFSVLSEPMLAFLREAAMDVNKFPESPAARRFRLFFQNMGEVKGEAKGKREALLAVLAARGISATDEERARIAACTEGTALDCWIEKAATATSMHEVLGAKPAKAARRSPPKARALPSTRGSRKPAAR